MAAHAQPIARKNRILLIDDHPIVTQGLARLIDSEPDMEVCGAADCVQSALQMLAHSEPDVLVLDISLSGPDGLDFLKNIRARNSRLPVLVLSMHDERIYAERALRAGANGYIMKQEAPEKVLVALRKILNGEMYLSDPMAGKISLHDARGSGMARHFPVADLSGRELEVFRLIGEGYATRQIAEKLRLSAKTVETYQAHIKVKLSLRNARELMQRAIEWNLSEKNS